MFREGMECEHGTDGQGSPRRSGGDRQHADVRATRTASVGWIESVITSSFSFDER
jgi:hypothetical protein